MYLLGYDIGSSAVKVALVHAATGNKVAAAQHPEQEMVITAPQADWAEQNPADWWSAACAATKKVLASCNVRPEQIMGIGIAYQMHGLVLLSKAGTVLRPAIIWCDSRAVDIGNQAFEAIGEAYCLEHYLNSPGNFTASKLRWVQENEPDVFAQIAKIMLPGDYIAYCMTGEICTTITGLSEGIFWDFKENSLAKSLLQRYRIPEQMLPPVVPVFAEQGKLTATAATALGLVAGIPIGYRAGDQPNNALSLNVLRPGEIAATGGTSGVVYAVTEKPLFDPELRVNSFAHVNYAPESPLTGVLLCINGAGIAYRWMRQILGDQHLSYQELEEIAATVGVGSEGLIVWPFGNGAERMLGNKNPGATFAGIQFNRHDKRHFYRAVLEGIAFSFIQGVEVLRDMGIPVQVMRVGNDNLFQSAIFAQTISTLLGVRIEVIDTTGAVGAAKAAGVSVGLFSSIGAAMEDVSVIREVVPGADRDVYLEVFDRWRL
jgi:xylulokinase